MATTSLRTRLTKAAYAAARAFRTPGPGAEAFMTPRAPVIPGKPQGQSGTPAYGGYVVSRETQDSLRGINRFTTFDNMFYNTGIVSASVGYYLNLLTQPGWEFNAVNDTDEAKRYADMTSEAMRDYLETPWHQIVKRAATYRLYGFSLQEFICRRQENGMICLTDVQPRLQRTIERWDVDVYGEVYGVAQRSVHDGGEYYIPRRKLLYALDSTFDDSPEGLGLFRLAVKASRDLERLLQLQMWGYETDLKGMPVVRAPLTYLQELVDKGDLTQDEMDDIIAPFKEILRKHVRTPELGMLLDSLVYYSKGENAQPSPSRMFDFDIIKGEVTANAQKAVHDAIEAMNWDIARIFGTETLLLGSNGRGAYALSKDKTQNLLMLVDGVLLDVAAFIKRDIIGQIFRLNNWPKKFMPNPVTDAITYRDIETITGGLLELAKAGAPMSPDDPAYNVIRRAMRLPRAPEVNRQKEAEIALVEAQAAAALRKPSDDQKPTRGGE